MSYEAEKALVDAVNEIENFSDKMAYWNALERIYNKTGLSLMELGDTEEGRIKAADISRKIGNAMADKFGPRPSFVRLEIIDDGTLDTVVRHTRTGQSQSYSSEYRFGFDNDAEFLDAIENDFDD
jgi:hypothetical protein|tara:strand:- start:96 stop:470 length:375 start_codon:yes stop_codon:yes gene_type:complete